MRARTGARHCSPFCCFTKQDRWVSLQHLSCGVCKHLWAPPSAWQGQTGSMQAGRMQQGMPLQIAQGWRLLRTQSARQTGATLFGGADRVRQAHNLDCYGQTA